MSVAAIDRDQAFLAAVRSVADDVAAGHADAVDRDARFPQEAVSALRDVGALSALVPEPIGGGVSLEAIARACFDLGRRCSSTAMVFAMHQIQVATIVRHLQPGSWFEAYLRELAAEQRLIASVTSEIGTGGDMGRSIAAVTAVTGGALSLEKQAPTVSYGAYADDLLTTARRAPEAEPNDQVMILHRATDTELEPAGTWDTIGMRGTCSPGYLVRARFGSEQILPTPFPTMLHESVVPLSHILWSFVWLGIATEAFERGRSFVRAAARRKPGEPVPAAQSLSRVMAELSMLRAEVESGLRDLMAADETGRESLSTMASILRFNNLKLAASEQAPRVCMGVLEVIGIAGYKNDSSYGVGRQLRDALSARLMVANERIHAADAGLLLIAKEV
ncbi:MAG TPA: acyl-CoA dehydrogenase family protein [Solirubrobacteraceae bacterium]|nr:acyl-CoA dehydrogenase family protein [Solirubrobacteraceae bacterium]